MSHRERCETFKYAPANHQYRISGLSIAETDAVALQRDKLLIRSNRHRRIAAAVDEQSPSRRRRLVARIRMPKILPRLPRDRSIAKRLKSGKDQDVAIGQGTWA